VESKSFYFISVSNDIAWFWRVKKKVAVIVSVIYSFCRKGYELVLEERVKKMYYRNFIWIVLCVFLAGLASCTTPNGETAKVETETANDKIDDASSEVIISFGDKKLTMEQVKWMQPNIDDRNLPRLTNWWFENELLYAEAQRRGVTNERKVNFLADIMSKKQFGQELRLDVQNSATVSKEAILDYYEKNKDSDPRLKRRGSVSFSHVRTKTLAEAEAVLARVKGGEDIKALAKELSIDKDAKKEGIATNIRDYTLKRRFGSEFAKVIESAKANELIGPVKVRNDGYEVAHINEKVDSAILPLEEAEKQIRSKLERELRNDTLKELMDSLKEQAAEKTVKSERLIKAEKESEETTPNAPLPRKARRAAPR